MHLQIAAILSTLARPGVLDITFAPTTLSLFNLALLPALLVIIALLLLLLLPSPSRLPTLSTLSLRALRHGGPIPTHVAFVMDGNRRWARQIGLPAHEGHPQGGEKLIESLQWCLDAGVRVVTVYAFSIENFKRSDLEVDQLMALALRKFHDFATRTHHIHTNRVRVRVLGDLALIPPDLRSAMAAVMRDTAHYADGPTLNICFAYTARHDIASSVRQLATLCRDGQMRPEDITEDAVAACLSTGYVRGGDAVDQYPQLLVRTSGETRLSDFLLWEASDAILSFYPVLWPALSAWDFVQILLDYQAQYACRSNAQVRKAKGRESANNGFLRGGRNACSTLDRVFAEERSRYFEEVNAYCKTHR